MDGIKNTHGGLKRFIGILCFMIFGMVANIQQGQEFNILNLLYGAVVGLVFGFISTIILTIFLNWINPALRKSQESGFGRRAVSQGLIFLVPFTVMALIATYFLHWKSTALFLSAAISAVAVATGGEISKLYEKPKIWNNIIPSIIATGCSMLWMYLIVQITSLPSTLISLYNLATSFLPK
jgi:hypothetical protein